MAISRLETRLASLCIQTRTRVLNTNTLQMGLHTKGENGVKKVLKSRYEKEGAFQTFSSIGDVRRAMVPSRTNVTSVMDGNVSLHSPSPTNVPTF